MLELQCVFCVFVNVLCLSPAAGPTVKPSVSLLPPSSLQISGDSAALLCLLSSYSPQGALVSWTILVASKTVNLQKFCKSIITIVL